MEEEEGQTICYCSCSKLLEREPQNPEEIFHLFSTAGLQTSMTHVWTFCGTLVGNHCFGLSVLDLYCAIRDEQRASWVDPLWGFASRANRNLAPARVEKLFLLFSCELLNSVQAAAGRQGVMPCCNYCPWSDCKHELGLAHDNTPCLPPWLQNEAGPEL